MGSLDRRYLYFLVVAFLSIPLINGSLIYGRVITASTTNATAGMVVTAYSYGNQFGYMIVNMSSLNTTTISIAGTTFDVTANYVSTSDAGVTINNTVYSLSPNVTILLSENANDKFYAVIYNISKGTMISMRIYGIANATAFTNTTSNSTNSTVIITTKGFDYPEYGASFMVNGSTSVLSNLTITVSNATNSSPAAPYGYGKLLALSVNASSANENMTASLDYPCATVPGRLQPFILNNGVWIGVAKFDVNSSACTVSFAIPSDPVIGVFEVEASTSTTTLLTTLATTAPTTVATTIPTSAAQTTVAPAAPTSQSHYYISIIAIVVIVLLVIFYLIRRKQWKDYNDMMRRRGWQGR